MMVPFLFRWFLETRLFVASGIEALWMLWLLGNYFGSRNALEFWIDASAGMKAGKL